MIVRGTVHFHLPRVPDKVGPIVLDVPDRLGSGVPGVPDRFDPNFLSVLDRLGPGVPGIPDSFGPNFLSVPDRLGPNSPRAHLIARLHFATEMMSLQQW